MKRFAFLLSVEEYMIYRETPFCHNDNDLLKRTLIDLCDFAEQDVTALKLQIFDETSPKMVLEELEKLVGRTEEGDTILFYFAGHGITDDGESYLVLPHTDDENVKQTALPLRDISSVLRKRGRINLRIYDACHSGQDVRSATTLVPNSTQFTENLMSLSPEESYITLASCKESEYSYPDANLKHGVFTYYLHESLKEFNEGEEVIPEILKYKLCKKVKQWCEINGKVQTPTINSSISGNVSIATRKKTKEIEIVPAVKPTDTSVETLLTQLRAASVVDEEKQKQYLTEYLESISSHLKESLQKIKCYDCDIKLSKAIDVSEINIEIKKTIVSYVKSKRFIPRHEITLEKIYEKRRAKSPWEKQLGGFFGYREDEPDLKEIIYDISEVDWPNSYIEVSVDGDKTIVPKITIFFYLLPLQLTACIFGGYQISYEDETLERINTEKVINYEDNASIIPKLIDQLIEIVNVETENLIKKRLKYLQWEIKQ